ESWGSYRRNLLQDAAVRAGWPPPTLIAEPVAAAQYLISVLRHPVPNGGSVVVFDFGAGTLDIAVVQNTPGGFRVLGCGGLAVLGGLDIDAVRVEKIGLLLAQRAPALWQRLEQPQTGQDRRDRKLFWEDVRGAKEHLSRSTVAPVPIPGSDTALHLTRE